MKLRIPALALMLSACGETSGDPPGADAAVPADAAVLADAGAADAGGIYCESAVVAPACAVGHVAIDGDSVYYNEIGIGEIPEGFYRVPKTGGVPIRVGNVSSHGFLTVGAGRLWNTGWTQVDEVGIITAFSLETGWFYAVASWVRSNMVLDDTYLYYVDDRDPSAHVLVRQRHEDSGSLRERIVDVPSVHHRELHRLVLIADDLFWTATAPAPGYPAEAIELWRTTIDASSTTLIARFPGELYLNVMSLAIDGSDAFMLMEMVMEQRAGERAIYRTPLDGSTEPSLVAVAPWSYFLRSRGGILFWDTREETGHRLHALDLATNERLDIRLDHEIASDFAVDDEAIYYAARTDTGEETIMRVSWRACLATARSSERTPPPSSR